MAAGVDQITKQLRDAPRTFPTGNDLDQLQTACSQGLRGHSTALVRYDAGQGLLVVDYFDGTRWQELWQSPPTPQPVKLRPVQRTPAERKERRRRTRLRLVAQRAQLLTIGKPRKAYL